MLAFRKWLEVGQTGGVGGGLEPPKLNPLERGTNAFPHYNRGDNPPVGWSKERRRVVKKRKV
jgi:hypothetical protein